MTWIPAALLMLFAATVQVTWAPAISVHGAFPNLVLVIVTVITWTRGQRAGLLWACAGGLLLDLAAPGPLGPHALALLVGAYVTGFWVRNVDRSGPAHPVIAAAVSTAIYSAVLVGADDLLNLPVPAPALVLELAVAAAVYNSVLVLPIMLVAQRLRQEAAG